MFDKIKLGIMDLLTILLPGGILLIISRYSFTDLLKGCAAIQNKDWAFVALFASLSYIAGHFIFLLASFLDELVYDKVKTIYCHHHNKLIARVRKIKTEALGFDDSNTLNAFQWSTMWLIMHQPSVYAEVEKYIAESKFFRSLTIVLATIPIFFFIELFKDHKATFRNSVNWPETFIVFTLIIFSLVRYVTRRIKSIETAYIGVILANKGINDTAVAESVSELDKRNIHPSQTIYHKIINDEATLWDKLKYPVIKFVYAFALCFVPFFSYFSGKKTKGAVTVTK